MNLGIYVHPTCFSQIFLKKNYYVYMKNYCVYTNHMWTGLSSRLVIAQEFRTTDTEMTVSSEHSLNNQSIEVLKAGL